MSAHAQARALGHAARDGAGGAQLSTAALLVPGLVPQCPTSVSATLQRGRGDAEPPPSPYPREEPGPSVLLQGTSRRCQPSPPCSSESTGRIFRLATQCGAALKKPKLQEPAAHSPARGCSGSGAASELPANYSTNRRNERGGGKKKWGGRKATGQPRKCFLRAAPCRAFSLPSPARLSSAGARCALGLLLPCPQRYQRVSHPPGHFGVCSNTVPSCTRGCHVPLGTLGLSLHCPELYNPTGMLQRSETPRVPPSPSPGTFQVPVPPAWIRRADPPWVSQHPPQPPCASSPPSPPAQGRDPRAGAVPPRQPGGDAGGFDPRAAGLLFANSLLPVNQ